MTTFLPSYGTTEGPLGFPMSDQAAHDLEALLDTLPEIDYQRAVITKATTELSPGERADVSWISTEALDREREVVLNSGMNDTHFKQNPVVTLNHNYSIPPIGESLWRRKVRDGQFPGIKTKTVYPPRPDNWKDDTWAPDAAFALVQSGLLCGKSIGYLKLKSHSPTEDEVRKRPELAQCFRIVDEWLLLEYCCTWLPINPEALVEAVAKSAVPIPTAFKSIMGFPDQLASVPSAPSVPLVPFTPLAAWVMRKDYYSRIMNRRADAANTGDRTGPFLFHPSRRSAAEPVPLERYGTKVVRSGQVSNTRTKGAGSNLTYVLLGYFPDWIVARLGIMEFAMNPWSDTAFQNDQVWLRGIQLIDAGARHGARFCLCDQLVQS